jgi:hypothetical protein
MESEGPSGIVASRSADGEWSLFEGSSITNRFAALLLKNIQEGPKN